jgi:hypothetical protein
LSSSHCAEETPSERRVGMLAGWLELRSLRK